VAAQPVPNAILRPVDVITEVTPHGVRDGEPDALAELCARRGAAVLAFAEHVAAPGQASGAAADAFGRFRATVAAATELDGLDPDALLLSATRSAALAFRASAMSPLDDNGERPDECVRFDRSLVQWIEDKLPPARRESFESHVADCRDCGATIECFEAAERAYQDPPKAPLPPAIARAIVGALAAAAPVTAFAGDPQRVREAAARKVLAAHPPAAAKQRPRQAHGAGPARAAAAGVARTPPGLATDRSPAARLRTALHERRRMAGRPAPTLGPQTKALALSLLGVLTVGVGGGVFLTAVDQPPAGGLPVSAGIALIVLGVGLWMALIRWTYTDARRRLSSSRLVSASAALAVLPILGPVLYMILRPPESLDDAEEREISISSSERLIALLVEMQQTQREIQASVTHLEQAMHSRRRAAAARQAAGRA